MPYKKIGLAVESMKQHTTSEGWELFAGLESAGYSLCGYNLPLPETDVRQVLERYDPDIVVIQDKREWDLVPKDFREPRARFTNTWALRQHRSYVVTILKDAQQRPEYHKAAAEEIGCNLHVVYYDEAEVRKLAPYLGKVVRTYHSLDSTLVPPIEYYRPNTCLLSGAISKAYPLRERLSRNLPRGTNFLKHPGYHRNGCATPSYLKTLSTYRVAICTASVYNYALRKMIEATACGCAVITNFPQRYCLPHIDGNLFRISDDISINTLSSIIESMASSWDMERQKFYSDLAKKYYDYHVLGKQLADDIDRMAKEDGYVVSG